MQKTYEIIGMEKYKSEKKNILVFLLERNLSKKTNMLSYNYILNAVKILQKDFNVFLIARSSSSKGIWIDVAKNTPILDKCIYINLDKTGDFISVKTGEQEYYEDNKLAYNYTYNYMDNLFTNFIKGEKWFIDNLVGTITSAFFLVYERAHEVIPSNEREEKLLKSALRTAQNRLSGNQQFFSFRMISQRNMYPLYLLVRLMKERQDLWHYSFCHDTSSIWYPFSAKVNPLTKNVKCFYFVNDDRGLRDFKEFPSAQIQDAYGKKQLTEVELNEILDNKKADFLFGGTFPYDVGYRLQDWVRYFENLSVNATIRTQTDGTSTITQSEIKDPLETKKFKGKKIKDQSALDVIKSISVNPNVKPTVSQAEYHAEQKDYMFTIILKCFYGKYDSLNFRIYSSLANGVIPLLADNYDIDDLQVPEKFKRFLVVKDHTDIEAKVKFFKDYPEEYKDLFWALYNHYVKSEHYSPEWYEQVFKENYFKEIY